MPKQKRPHWFAKHIDDFLRSHTPRWLQVFYLEDLLVIAWALLVFLLGVYYNFYRVARAPFSIGLFCYYCLLDLLSLPGRITGHLFYESINLLISFVQQSIVCPSKIGKMTHANEER